MTTTSQKRTFFRLIILVGLLGAIGIGVSSCDLPDLAGLLQPAEPTLLPGTAGITPTPSPSATPEGPLEQSRTLIVWVPPQFDPESGTPAGDLFLARLQEFSSRRPQIEIQVRVKALTGEYGLLGSLRLIDSAAPLLKPDLIALPRLQLEQAYRESLIRRLDDLDGDFIPDDWYLYALDLAQVDGVTAGIPFAGDLMALAYKTDSGENPPPDWNSLLSSQKTMAFAASDIRGLTTLALYQSLDGQLVDDSGSLTIDPEIMLELLTFYQQAQAAGVMPYWLTQFETEAQAWQSYLDRQSTLALTWSSVILGSDSANTSLAAMPTREGKAFSYASGWAWSLVPSDLENERVALELAEFLADDDFLADWGLAAGYMPVQPRALEAWSDQPSYPTLQKLLPAAILIPDNYQIAELGPDIKGAVVAVLKDQVAPTDALEALLESLPAP